jgi:hypothetical protein
LPFDRFAGQTPDEKRRPRDVEFTGCEIKRTCVDKGYRGHDTRNPRRVFTPGQDNFGAIKRVATPIRYRPVIGQHINAQSSLLTDDQYREGLCKFFKGISVNFFFCRGRGCGGGCIPRFRGSDTAKTPLKAVGYLMR